METVKRKLASQSREGNTTSVYKPVVKAIVSYKPEMMHD